MTFSLFLWLIIAGEARSEYCIDSLDSNIVGCSEMNSAIVPVPVEDVQGDLRWMSLHEHYVALCKEKEPEVLFVGDSIIQQLQQTETWQKFLVPLHSMNVGIGGDQTQHVLWRLQNGELENIEPKVVVLCVGTNNHGHNAEEITLGILEIVDTVHARQPQAHVLVMGIPPRGKRPNKIREKIEQVNLALADKLTEIENASFFAIDPNSFVHADGSISVSDMYDFLHFTKKGYQKLTEPLIEEVETLLKNFMTADSLSQGDIVS